MEQERPAILEYILKWQSSDDATATKNFNGPGVFILCLKNYSRAPFFIVATAQAESISKLLQTEKQQFLAGSKTYSGLPISGPQEKLFPIQDREKFWRDETSIMVAEPAHLPGTPVTDQILKIIGSKLQYDLADYYKSLPSGSSSDDRSAPVLGNAQMMSRGDVRAITLSHIVAARSPKPLTSEVFFASLSA